MRRLILTLTILATTQIPAANADQQKLDVLGLFTGMPSNAVAELLRNTKWRCRNVNDPIIGKKPDPITGDYSFNCDTQIGQLNFTLAGSLAEIPLSNLRLFFETSETIENVARSITQQYSKDLSSGGGDAGYEWSLDNGSKLRLSKQMSGYMLDLYSAPIMEANRKAKATNDAARNPTPKF